ncbi:MAG: DNA repair protein RecO [Bdellovibrionales bacterium]|nr:DNA repair protein RecO [Bdellovibrionales bacterium]
MNSVSDRLIILRAIKHSEADLILHTLSAQHGRLNLIAKGALKSKKRFVGGVLEPTHFIEAQIKKKNDFGNGTLHFLEDAQLLKGFEGLRQDYDRLTLAFHFLDLITKVLQEEDPESKKMFDLVGNALQALESSHRPDLLRLLFEGKLLLVQGVIPSDLPKSDLFRLSLQDHEKSQISMNELSQLRGHIQYALKSYL